MNILPPKYDRQLDQASNGLGLFFSIVLAAIVVLWICHDTSAGLTESIHHTSYNPFRPASTIDLIKEWL